MDTKKFADLRLKAQAIGIPGYSKMRKTELSEAVKLHDVAQKELPPIKGKVQPPQSAF